MNIAQSTFYAMAISICVLFCFIAKRSLSKHSLVFFMCFCTLTCVSLVMEWLLRQPDTILVHLSWAILMCTALLSAPVLWLFARETAESHSCVKKFSAIDVSLTLLGMLALVPLVILPTWQTVDFSTVTRDQIIHGSMLFSVLIYVCQVPLFLHKCMQLLKFQKQHYAFLFADVDDMPLNVLRMLIWIVFCSWLLNITRTLMIVFTDGESLIYTFIALVQLCFLAWATYEISLNKALSNNRYVDHDVKSSGEAKIGKRTTSNSKYVQYAMDNEGLERIRRKILIAMETDRIYEQSHISLEFLCQHINEAPHYVSQVLNQELRKSFYHVVNDYRISAAKRALIETPNASITDIANDVGYNTKSTFNSAFKRITGVTPSAFRSRHR